MRSELQQLAHSPPASRSASHSAPSSADRPVIFALGALLVPWTILVALSDTQRWFASRREQTGWITFDAV